MTTAANQLLQTLLQLTPADRAELAAQLLESLDSEIDDSASEAWDKEIQQRIEDVRSGRVKTVPWSQARVQIRSESC
ncbi:MAG: addiction module protein [Planctomycetes bacterium]|nr:addiction module protein [Planctomycetota bacterium]